LGPERGAPPNAQPSRRYSRTGNPVAGPSGFNKAGQQDGTKAARIRETREKACRVRENANIGFVPNQRSKTKVRLGGFIERELYLAVLAEAKLEGMSRDKFGFAQKLLQEAIERREKRAEGGTRVGHVR
jgi:hypothetical protein